MIGSSKKILSFWTFVAVSCLFRDTEARPVHHLQHVNLDAVKDGNDTYGQHKLTREYVFNRAKSMIVMLTWTNHHYVDFAANWIHHLHRLDFSAYIVGALDDQALKALLEMGESPFSLQGGVQTGDITFQSSDYHKVGRIRTELIVTLTHWGFDVIVSDVDVAWLRDPLPYFAQFPDGDIFTISDMRANTTNSNGLEIFNPGEGLNIGITFIRKSAAKFAQEWHQTLLDNEKIWDQGAFNDLIKRDAHKFMSDERADRLFRGYGGTMLVGILPVAIFANPHTLSFQNLAHKMGLQLFAIHNHFVFSGAAGKRHRFREKLHWLADGPEYYDPPGGLLAFSTRINHLLEAASKIDLDPSKPIKFENFFPHFHLVNAQLSQLRNAYALSLILGRTLVLPNLISGVDRYWAPFRGVIPGTPLDIKLPRPVPAEYILNLEALLREGGGDPAGLHVSFREHSFFQNDRVPANVKNGWLRVHVCQAEEYCPRTKADLQTPEPMLHISPFLRDSEIHDILKIYQDKKVIYFDDASNAFGGFDSPEAEMRFETKTKDFGDVFCCTEGKPGHTFYDFWWDKPGHKDRFNNVIEEWVPQLLPQGV